MIKELHISNFAVIEDTTLSFGSPYLALVGETGAGKSLIVESLGLIRGDKADFTKLRDPAKKAVVSALFSLSKAYVSLHPEVGTWLDSEGSLLLKRTLNPDRTSRYYVNDEPVTLTQFKDLSQHLIDIHSQGQNWELYDEKNHLAYLDRFGGKNLALDSKAYQEAYQGLVKARTSLEELLKGQEGLDRDYLEFQIKEIERYHLKPNEIEDLNQEYLSLRDLERLTEKYQEYDQAATLPEGKLSDVIAHLQGKLSTFSDTSLAPQASALQENLRSALDSFSVLEEAYRELNSNPKRLDEINQRLYDLKGLQRKYGKTTAEILAKEAEYKAKLDAASHFEEAKEDANYEIHKAEEACRKAGALLTQDRQEAKIGLEKAIGKEMGQLGLPSQGFRVSLTAGDISPTGLDVCAFETALNAGLDFASLKEAASGGESSRLMLSLKVVLNGLNPYDLLVFDEIDTGISGRVAALVAKKIQTVSTQSQVLVISHLPQVVASAEEAWKVEKKTTNGMTYTTAHSLTSEGLIKEVATMISGKEVTPAALAQAQALIQESQPTK